MRRILLAIIALAAFVAPASAFQATPERTQVDQSHDTVCIRQRSAAVGSTVMQGACVPLVHEDKSAGVDTLDGSLLSGVPAGPMLYSPFGAGGVPATLQAYLDQFVFAKLYGLTCDGGAGLPEVTANTTALTNAGAAASGSHKTVALPAGTCVHNPFTVPAGVTVQGGGQDKTTLQLAAGQSHSVATGSRAGIVLSNDSGLQDLTYDGNKAAQVEGMCGLFGNGVTDVKITDVTVQNVLGMGDCMQNASHVKHTRETVTGTQLVRFGNASNTLTILTSANGTNGSGFWEGTYVANPVGDISYIDCIATLNDLDGLEFSAPNTTIRGGQYNFNGQFTDLTTSDQTNAVHSRILTGGTGMSIGTVLPPGSPCCEALGAAGIYFAQDSANGTPAAALRLTIEGVEAANNSESGFDLQPGNLSTIGGNASHDNGTYGYNLHGRVADAAVGRFVFAWNVAARNGNTTNATFLGGNAGNLIARCGIGLTGYITFANFEGNISYDDRSSGATQLYGICAEFNYSGAVLTLTQDRFLDNHLKFNAAAPTNFEGTLPASMSGSIYTLEQSSATPTLAVQTSGATPPVFAPATNATTYSRDATGRVSLNSQVNVTTRGTASGYLSFSLPVTPTKNGKLEGYLTTSGKVLLGKISNGSNTAQFTLYDGTTPFLADGDFFVISGSYY